MARQKESRLQRETRRALEYYVGGVWYKHHASELGEPGIGDLVGCVRGLHIEVEVKREHGELRDTQRLRKWRITYVGEGAYFVARSPMQAVFKVTKYLRQHGKTPLHKIETVPDSGGALRLPKKDRRVIHATEDGKNPYHLVRSSKNKPRKRIA